jgi:hypothetical protein
MLTPEELAEIRQHNELHGLISQIKVLTELHCKKLQRDWLPLIMKAGDLSPAVEVAKRALEDMNQCLQAMEELAKMHPKYVKEEEANQSKRSK